MDQTFPLDGWFRIATQGLSEKAKSYLWQQSEIEYQAAVQIELENGFPEGQARNLAALALGDPHHIKKKFKNEYLTQYELRTVSLFQNSFYTLLFNLFPVFFNAGFLFFFINSYFPTFTTGFSLIGIGITLLLSAMAAFSVCATFFILPRLRKQADGLERVISLSIFLHESSAAFLFAILLFDISASISSWDVFAYIMILNWIGFMGIFGFAVYHKLKIVQKLKKHSRYLSTV